ncbi:MAG: hypothetical protein WC503_02415 [Candidatus Shapirobacteria bacterium]
MAGKEGQPDLFKIPPTVAGENDHLMPNGRRKRSKKNSDVITEPVDKVPMKKKKHPSVVKITTDPDKTVYWWEKY